MADTGLVVYFAGAANNDNNPAKYKKEDLFTDIPATVKFRLPLTGQFNALSGDPDPEGRKDRSYSVPKLWNDVVSKEGKVSPAQARRFIDDYLSGAFARDPGVSDPRAKQGLNTLGFETLLNLYEAIALDKGKNTSLYLQQINQALDLGKDFYENRVKPVGDFFSEANKPDLEQEWARAKKEGRVNAKEGSFADTMADLMGRPELTTKEDLMRRYATLQFICDAYSKQIGETSVSVKLFNADPALRGFHASKAEAGEEVIGINLPVLTSFQAAIGVLMHERQHASQDRLAQALRAGKIREGDPDYVAARVFAANRDNNGYISPEAKAGHWGYRYQPLEIDAHNAGFLAEYMSYKTYARTPGIIYAPDLKAA